LCVLWREWSEGRNVVLRIILQASAMSVHSVHHCTDRETEERKHLPYLCNKVRWWR
jgi:hypothetical protein